MGKFRASGDPKFQSSPSNCKKGDGPKGRKSGYGYFAKYLLSFVRGL